MRTSSVLLPLLALVVFIGSPSDAPACSCTNLPDFTRAYQQSQAIFMGEVLEIASAAPEYPYDVRVTFQVEADWKGDVGATVAVLTPDNEGTCGFPFVVGTRYLVYALGAPYSGELSTGLCWRTHETWPEDPDLALLDPTPVSTGSWGSVKVRYR